MPIPQLPQPATMPRYDNMGTYAPNQYGHVKMGTTANDIINQVTDNQQRRIQQMNEQLTVTDIVAWERERKQEQIKQMQELQREIEEAFPNRTQNVNRFKDMSYINTPEFKAKTKSYRDALSELKSMLSGKKPISVADAYFHIEMAYGKPYLTKKEFDGILNQSAAFIKTWLSQNNYDIKNNEHLHLGIQKFLSEKLTINKTSNNKENGTILNTIIHQPFFYDFEDYKGEHDFRNYFLTKCLATGTGQCNSMPAVYLALAERLKVIASLSFVPQHGFVKYKDNQGHIRNYEPTSNWEMSDQWYADNFYISPTSKRSGIYLNALNNRQIVANCIIDLGSSYMYKYGATDGEFVKDCIRTAIVEFPKNNNIHAYFLYSMYLKGEISRIMHKNRLDDPMKIDSIPEAAVLHKEWQMNEAFIKKLGYQEMPKGLYESIMQNQEFKGKRQQAKGIETKKKHSLFIPSK